MVLIKDESVSIKTLNSERIFLLSVLDSVFNRAKKDCVITSANDGHHMETSYHYTNDAFDLRSQHLTDKEKTSVYLDLKNQLMEKGYDVILELRGTPQEHFHVEYDRRRANGHK